MGKVFFIILLLSIVLFLNAQDGSLRILADFGVEAATGYAPFEASFRDLTTDGIAAYWEWDFQNDGIIDSYERNPEWLYNEPGVYSVRFTVQDSAQMDSSSIVKYDIIIVNALPEGIVAFYPFSGNADDMSANEYHGTITGATLAHDRYNRQNSAYRYDGNNDRLSIPHNLFSDGFPFSVSFWIKPEFFWEYSNLIMGSKSWNGSGQDVYHALCSVDIWTDRLHFSYGDGYAGGPENRITYTSFYPFAIDQWDHIVIISEGMELNESRVFINGIERDFQYGGGSGNSVSFSGGTLDVGSVKGNNFGYDEFTKFNGIIDDIQIYNTALTEAEVIDIYNPDLIANFQADTFSGYAPLIVEFTDTSIHEIPVQTWCWDFDSDGTIDSNEQDPIYTYNEAGTYTVILTVSDSISTDTKIRENYITVETTNIEPEIITVSTQYLSNYPNPFNPQTTIEYQLMETKQVLIEVYNIKGQKIDVILNKTQEPGYHSIAWDAHQNPSGIYLIRFFDGSLEKISKVVLMK